MSLSSLLNDRGSKERAFILASSPLLAATIGSPAGTTSPSLRFGHLINAQLLVERERAVDAGAIGMAFDYRARFELGGFDPQSTVAALGLEHLQTILHGAIAPSSPHVPKNEFDWVQRDEHAFHKFDVLRHAFELSRDLLAGSQEDRNRAAIVLAWCEQAFRIGTRSMEGSLGRRLTEAADGGELAARIESSWLRDLDRLCAAAQPQLDEWVAMSADHGDRSMSDPPWSTLPGEPPVRGRPFYLPNPGFLGSGLVGGADGDWIIGDTLIDCKTDQTITVGSLREHLLQLIGYVLLDLDDWYQIRKVAIWYPRFGLLPTWSLDLLLSGESADLLPPLRNEVRKGWGKKEALAMRQPIDQRRIGVLLAQNLNTPFEMLAELVATTSDALTLKHVANNRSTPQEVLRELAVHREATVREQVAKNPATPVDLLLQLQDDQRINVRRAAVSNPSLPIEQLLSCVNDATYQAAAAANPALPVERLMELASDSLPLPVDLRKAIAKNPTSTPDVLRALNYWDAEATLVLRRAEMTPELVAYIYASELKGDVEYLQNKLRRAWSFQAIGQRPRLHVIGGDQFGVANSANQAKLGWLMATGTSVSQLRAMTSLDGSSIDDSVTAADEIPANVLAETPELQALKAVNALVSPGHLRELARQLDPVVRAGVALNPNTPPDVLSELRGDPVELVRRMWAWNPTEAVFVSLFRIEAEIAEFAGMPEYSERESASILKSLMSELERTWRAAIRVAIERQAQLSKLLVASTKADHEIGRLERKLLGASPARQVELTRVIAEKRKWASDQRDALQSIVLEVVPERRSKLDRLRKRLNQLELLLTQQQGAAAAQAADRRYFFGLHPEYLPQLEAAARSAHTVPEVVARLAELQLGNISVYAALNKCIDFDAGGDIVANCFKHSDGCWSGRRCDPVLSRLVAAFAGTPVEILQHLVGSCGHLSVRSSASSELVRRGIEAASNPGREPSTEVEFFVSPATDLAAMALSSELSARAFAAGHTELAVELMIQMASDARAEVRMSLAKNPSAPTEILDFLGGEKSIQVRRTVASHPNARPSLLEQLAKENDYEIHWRLASNIATPPELLARLASDPEVDIAVSAILNSSTPRRALEVVALSKDDAVGALAGALASRSK